MYVNFMITLKHKEHGLLKIIRSCSEITDSVQLHDKGKSSNNLCLERQTFQSLGRR